MTCQDGPVARHSGNFLNPRSASQQLSWRRWLLGWELWVTLHLLVAWFMPGILRALAAPSKLPLPAHGEMPMAGKTRLHSFLSSAALPAYHVLMALVLPAATGVVAFGSPVQLLTLQTFLWH